MFRTNWCFALLSLLLLLAGCATTGEAAKPFAVTSAATYAGTLPCADCPGIRHTLNLFPDKVYFLRTEYLERRTFYDIGAWSLSSDQQTLMLRGGREAPERYAIKGADVLRKLDIEGREIQTRLNYDLRRAKHFQPVEPRLLMRGMYSYMADAGIFEECLTRRRFPVAMEGDNAKLESEYTKLQAAPAQPLLASVEGRIVMRPPMEGPGERLALIPERYVRITPGETCGPRFSTATLENTYWKLTRLDSEAVITRPGVREIHFVLVPDERRVQGFSGCNQLAGAYALDDKGIRFGPLISTRMACAGTGMTLEFAFLKALQSASTWNILGEHLELYNADRKLLARFESRYMK